DGEAHASRDIRKHIGWYLRGFPVGGGNRSALARVESLQQLRELLAPWADSPALAEDADGPRGRQGSPGKVVLPEGWLDDPEDESVPEGAELMHSGGYAHRHRYIGRNIGGFWQDWVNSLHES